MFKRCPLLFAIALSFFCLSFTGTTAQVIISEFMASNTRTLADEDGDYSDWIEVFNSGSTNVNLNGWALTDDPARPRRWRFPSVQLAPGEALIVFASNKDRRTAGSPLHTDFRIGSSGGYLALTDPNGEVVFDYGISYPTQVPDVSFGVTGEESSTVILPTSTPLKYFVPESDALGLGWTALEFPVENWRTGQNGIGFDHNLPQPSDAYVDSLTNSAPHIYFRFQETSGTLATNSGSLGTTFNGNYTGGMSLNQLGLRPPEGAGMSTNNSTPRFDGSNDYVSLRKPLVNNAAAFSMSAWIKPISLSKQRVGLWGQHEAIEFGFIDARLLQLSTLNGGTVQAEFPLPANQWRHVAVTGDGEVLRIFIDGIMVAEGGSPTGDYGSSQYPFVIGGGGIFDAFDNWFNGNIDEFAYFNRALSPDEIQMQWQAAKAPTASYSAETSHEVSADMAGKNSSIYLRYEVVSANQWEGLALKVQSDDGFVAYLNGVEVARQNAPEILAWNSAATVDRPRTAGLATNELDLSHALGFLHSGTNLLAVHALNSSASNPDFYFKAELLGLRRSVQTNSLRYFSISTPGRMNGVGDLNSGPLVLNATFSPNPPTDANDILVTAKMVKTFHQPLDLTLVYRVMFGTEVSVLMRDDGLNGDALANDATFSAKIPASAASMGQMVRWFFRAQDIQGNITRWPTYKDTRNSPQYFGTVIQDTRLTNNLPVLHWFVQTPAAADGTGGTRAAIYWKGEFYDNIFVNLHGQSSQGFPKKSYNMDFNTGYHMDWNGEGDRVEDINLLTTYPDKAHVRNILAYETFRDAGSPYHFVVPVRVERNGSFFSDAHMVEDGDEDYLARVGLDPKGALYKMYNSLESATTGAEKKTRDFENNNDLQSLIIGLARTGTSRTAFIYDNVNIPALVNYLAAMIITGNTDCCHKNYYVYRDSEGTGEWQMLPWDLDLSFGRNWTSAQNYYDDTMYSNNPLFIGSGNALANAVFNTPALRQMYLRRLRTLMDELMQAPGTPASNLKYEARIRELYEQIGPDAALDFAKWPTWGTPQKMPQALSILTNQYMPARRNYLFNNLRSTIPAEMSTNLTLRFGAYEANPTNGLQTQEYFTLVNTNNVAVDISGWKVENGVEHVFAPGTVLATNMTIYLSPDVNAFRQRQTGPRAGQGLFIQGNYKGQLSARGETLVLKDNYGRMVDQITLSAQPTQGQQFLRVTEIMYAPGTNTLGFAREELEYLTLQNIGSIPMNLRGVHFTNGITFAFTSDLVLEPSNSVYIVKNPQAFQAVYGEGLRVVGPFSGQLSNEGEVLELYDAGGEKILDFAYNNAWHPLTEGAGYSLVIKNINQEYALWGTKESWAQSSQVGGTAAGSGANDWAAFQTTYFSSAEIANPQVSGATADPDQDGMNNNGEFIAGTHPKDAVSVLKLKIAQATTSNIEFEIHGVAGRTYTIWSTSDLLNPAWTRAVADVRASQDGPLKIPVATNLQEQPKYFKVSVQK